ncbi:MAG: hypothetical protein JW910_16930, partial [Anaerolineae bacterium]|nr:hypothetical protein [Anaerolineae bacterium]
MTDYLKLAQDVVKQAAARGVEAEAFIMDEQETTIQLGNGEIEKLAQAGSKGMGVRVIDGGRVGYAYTSDFSPESIATTWQTAIELAAVASADDFRRLPEPQDIPDEDLEIYDAALPDVTPQPKIDLAKRVTQAGLDHDERITMVPMTQYQDTITHVYLANSKGFAGAYDRTAVFCF